MIIREVLLPQVWAMRHEVMYPELTIADMRLDDDESGEHYGIYEEDKLISVVSVFVREDQLQFRKFATLNAFQGKGYGSKLLRVVFEKAAANNLQSVWCNARLTAVPFYERFGMRQTGTTWKQLGHLFVKMEKVLR